MSKFIIAGNWKMNQTSSQTKAFLEDIEKQLPNKLNNTRIIIAPSYVSLETAVKSTESSVVEIAAQNIHQEKNGAYTGEISSEMLQDINVKTVIIGHSERRQIFKETDELLAEKVKTAIDNGFEIIFCIGETLEERKLDHHLLEVGSQLKKSLFQLSAEDWEKIIIAYEPVWAIGTGETATPEQAQEMHQFIRGVIEKNYNSSVSENLAILYGGSVKPANASEIFSQPDVNGVLVGGASLQVEDFMAIINSY